MWLVSLVTECHHDASFAIGRRAPRLHQTTLQCCILKSSVSAVQWARAVDLVWQAEQLENDGQKSLLFCLPLLFWSDYLLIRSCITEMSRGGSRVSGYIYEYTLWIHTFFKALKVPLHTQKTWNVIGPKMIRTGHDNKNIQGFNENIRGFSPPRATPGNVPSLSKVFSLQDIDDFEISQTFSCF